MSSASKQHHTLEDDDLLPSKHMPPTSSIKLIASKKYNRKSISVIKEYISSCKMIFWLLKSNYSDNTMKVLYVSQFLMGEMKKVWLYLDYASGC